MEPIVFKKITKSRHTSGYIMIFALMLVGVLTGVATFVALRSSIFTPRIKQSEDFLQARLLAYSGIEIVCAQLTEWLTEKKQEGQEQTGQQNQTRNGPANLGLNNQKKKSPLVQIFEKLLPKLNVWQELKLNTKEHGVNGVIKTCITAESGKIDLNALWDFKQKRFVFEGQEKNPTAAYAGLIPTAPAPKELWADIFKKIEQLSGGTNLLTALGEYFKKRGFIINDPTDLLMIKEFEVFQYRQFYNPDEPNTIALSDIFTTVYQDRMIDPILFSSSMKKILDIPVDSEKKDITELLNAYNDQANWKSDWNKILRSWYEKDFNNLPKGIESILSRKSVPKLFSVLSYAIIGKTTVKMLAIVQLDKKEKKSDGKKSEVVEVTIRNLFWL